MKNKLLLIMGVFCILTFLSLDVIMAFEFDNVKEYNESLNEYKIYNTFLGVKTTEIAAIKLLTPHIVKVMRGKNRLVGILEITSMEEYKDFLKKMDFIDIKNNNKKINRSFNLRYANISTYQEPIYTESCESYTAFNGGVNCQKTFSHYETREIVKWVDFNNPKVLPKGNVRLGIFADVEAGDYVDWIPYMFGDLGLNEFAVWTETMNNGLIAYWNFEQGNLGSGSNYTDVRSNYYNLTNAPYKNSTGIIGMARNITNSWNPRSLTQLRESDFVMGTAVPFAISIWVMPQICSGNDKIISIGNQTVGVSVGNSFGIQCGDSNTLTIGGYYVGAGAAAMGIIPTTSYTHFAWNHFSNGTNVFYINGVYNKTYNNNNFLMSTVHNISFGENVYLGAGEYYEGNLDEFGFWNRTLTINEITSLYNGGSGITYTTDYNGTITLNEPINNYVSNFSDIMFNCTANSGNGILNLSILIDNQINYTVYNNSVENTTMKIERTISGLSEGNHTWTCNMTNIENKIYTKSAINISIDRTVPIITNDSSINITTINCLNGNSTVKWKIYDNNLWKCVYNYNSTNITLEPCNNYTYMQTNISKNFMELWAYDKANNSNYLNLTWNVYRDYFTINVYNYKDELIEDINITGDVNGEINPYQTYIDNYLNDSLKFKNLTINVKDTSLYNVNKNTSINLTYSTQKYNITLDAVQLILTFYQNNSLYYVQGEISDNDKAMRFNDTSMVIVQQNLSKGYVKAVFGMINYTNWTQFYEYTNDYVTHINETLEVLWKSDWKVYFDVRDIGNSPIKDAIIRAYAVNPNVTTSWYNYKFIGQRLTKDDGSTFFNFDSNTFVRIQIAATGYDAQNFTLRIGDESANTKETSIPIKLRSGSYEVTENLWLYLPYEYDANTTIINGSLSAPNRDIILLNTNYRNYRGLGNKTLIKDNWNRYKIELSNGTDYLVNNQNDIYVEIWVDGILKFNRTIDYKTYDVNIENNNYDTNTFVVAVGIIIIFVSGTFGFLFKNSSVGFGVFMIGTLVASMITINFLWLSLIGVMYFALKGIGKILKE